ncbi:hypothetical protein [Microbacterium sp. zg.Y909]|uniref:hypothetical protein n=1 Tax=Microbacterium sp. zg.Y909 TaxID=2969413 RepID=UPI00214C5BDC|nr:hypothetical protein [Microbacterium sp. zg.Y909]MCR2824408.1 hypothetical protein [Microbacterium sp. zg.Y909]MCR2825681.1 hypothetical protein [Microbacterium sp. zg.Y909]
MIEDNRSDTFIPAQTVAEAASRIGAITGARVEATRGEKRALLALRDALGIDVAAVRTNAVLGESLAEALGVQWDRPAYVSRNTLTIDGVNAILRAATASFRSGALSRSTDTTTFGLTGDRWAAFRPARTKIEAVNRISALTNSGPEWLGPGSKEHKRVLVNLAASVLPGVDTRRLTKTGLGAKLAAAFNVPWGDGAISTGETIRLEGLNALLAGAEEHFGVLGTDLAHSFQTPESEGSLLAAALKDGLPAGIWDGRSCVEWMTKERLRGANDSEWQGFFFEGYARQVLAKLPPATSAPRVKYGQTVFDFSLNYVWDLKAHTETYSKTTGQPSSGRVILNDEEAVRACVDEQGLGFLVLSGRAIPDTDGEFRAWQNARKGKPSAPSNSGKSRVRKAQFVPLRIESYWIGNSQELDAALLSGVVRPWKQPRQAPRLSGESGAERRTKMEMTLARARTELRVSAFDYEPATRVAQV